MDISSRMFLAKQSKLTQTFTSPFKSSLLQGKQSIDFVLYAIETVRQHRSYLYEKVVGDKIDAKRISNVKERLNKISNDILDYSYLGSRTERRILSRRLDELSQNSEQLSFAKQLVAHGQVIRLLMFCCDSAVLRSINTEDENLKEYNSQWQSLLDTVDALTQYRICISSVIEHGLRNPKLLLGRANNLLRKIQRYQDLTSNTEHNLAKVAAQLENSINTATNKTSVSTSLMYQDTKDISHELITLYKQIVYGQLNKNYLAKKSSSLRA
ncbi:hypothetical protein VHA01S_039_00230 [Vibrio halioticoli NBRC 102217]|uniref:Uncharacterized protein n=1 Tax=Vibrio halioticoli NBRC 102217 TaxID=1219072 RepID=V5FEZ5_9VIBR|nr:hypothetical protein [Vibrio halioticoli]GAD90303.1 hypothetical protein VHA01S_039_00230 [Vibrio halioticoli NBRC 102217]